MLSQAIMEAEDRVDFRQAADIRAVMAEVVITVGSIIMDMPLPLTVALQPDQSDMLVLVSVMVDPVMAVEAMVMAVVIITVAAAGIITGISGDAGNKRNVYFPYEQHTKETYYYNK